MKKFYLGITLMFAAFGGALLAQPLNGVYTINSLVATSGTNFQTFNAFATAINSQGVSGPVTVNVSNGPYNEQVTFTSITGASSINKVTINGNNCLITYNANTSSMPWTIAMGNTDWFVINNLQVQGTGGTYAYPLILYQGADNNVFSGCTFSCNANQGTGTGQIPVVVSGANNTYGSASNSGSNNTWDGCDMFGGYFAFTMYGPTSAGSYNFGNKILNCTVRDFYYYGIYSYYHDRVTIKGNILERTTRTTLQGNGYGIYCVITTGTNIEGNHVRKLFDQNQSMTGTFYCIYMQGNTLTTYNGDANSIKNNIISDIDWNGSNYCIMAYYIKGDVAHNTISFDQTTSTGGSLYGLYLIGTAGFETHAKNNLVYMTKGGSGTKYGIYHASTGYVTADYNDYYINSAGGTNYIGYYSGGNHATLAALQSASGMEANSLNLDPAFTNPALMDYKPTNVTMNNEATPVGVFFDFYNKVRHGTTPDIGAIEFLTPACSGTPGSNTVLTPNYAICPGENVTLGLSNLVSDDGLTYQWAVSPTSGVGPFTNVSGANSIFYTTPPLTANTWYQVVITCTNSQQSASFVGTITVAAPTTSTVPYYEGFEGIGLPNRMPNCSWMASSQGIANLTALNPASGNRIPRTGNGYASFSSGSPGTTYYYTNGIQMNTGITYSAALWYATEYMGYTNWTNLSIWVGPNQNPTGMVQVASVGPAISGAYKLLDNTFTVPSSGLYYVAIRATGTAGSAMFLTWDDLSITIPCHEGSPNQANMSLVPSSSVVCADDGVQLNASGAASYTWNTGANGSSLQAYPQFPTTYTVWGLNATTGCVAMRTQNIMVNPSPLLYVIASDPDICPGQSTNITAVGASSYFWTNNSTSPNLVVSPTVTTNYQVQGTNQFNCTANASITINVLTPPLVNINPSTTQACVGDAVVLTGDGALTYQWLTNNNVNLSGNPVTVTANASGTYTIIGTDAEGCQGTNSFALSVDACVGISELTSARFEVYPNPTSAAFTLSFGSETARQIVVSDLSGRVLAAYETAASTFEASLSDFAAGVYLVKVTDASSTQQVKVIKN